MNTRRFRLLGWLLLPLLTLALTAVGCGSDDDGGSGSASTDAPATASGDEEVNVGLFVLATANSYSQGHIEGAERKAEEMGATVEVFDGAFDPRKQQNQIQDAIASGRFDGFVIVANDGASAAPVAKEAIDQGIDVVQTYTALGPDLDSCEDQVGGLVAVICAPFGPHGEWMADQVGEACDGKDPCKAAIIIGGFDQPNEIRRLESFKEQLKEYPNVELVAEGEAQFLRDEGLATAQDQLQANRDIDVWATTGDQMSMGVEQAVTDIGRELGAPQDGGVAIISNAASKIGVKAIREGRWFSNWLFLPQSEAEQSVELVVKAARGEDVPFQSFVINEDLEPAKEIGQGWITPENVGDFEGQWEG